MGSADTAVVLLDAPQPIRILISSQTENDTHDNVCDEKGRNEKEVLSFSFLFFFFVLFSLLTIETGGKLFPSVNRLF